jgi:AraC family transcriptional regulator, regulatory protein of adaptative response / methylated-DNA-[protein]-cysteine methyltransferase
VSDFDRIATAIAYLVEHAGQQPSLADLAAHLQLSPFHVQRLFRRFAGITPKQFLQVLTVDHARTLLASAPLLSVSAEVGLSSASRLHDHFVTLEAMTPGEVRRGGAGLEIEAAVHDTVLGPALIAMTPRGICALEFLDQPEADAQALLRSRWPAAHWKASSRRTAAVAKALATPGENPLVAHVQGSNFQISVWRALLQVGAGQLISYTRLAAAAGQPAAARAVGQAVGANPVAVLIPCHRVIRESGALGGYRWGLIRKQALLARECASTLPGM